MEASCQEQYKKAYIILPVPYNGEFGGDCDIGLH